MATILVIDDTPEIVDLYEAILTDEGFEVVGSLQPIIDPLEIERIKPDLIILDWLFSKEATGKETLTRLLNNPPTASIPIIVCTGAKLKEDEEDELKERGIMLIYKPFNIQDLLSAVQHSLEKA
jgi:DNA-binding response OmpR family regulator